MIALFAGSLVLRALLILYGPGLEDPWTYRFFPTELALFLMGALSHRYLMPWLRNRNLLTTRNATVVTAVVILFCLSFSELPMQRASRIALIGTVALALPFLFSFQKSFRWDRRIGELSYPIYIVHWSVLYPVSFLWDAALGVEDYKGLDETFAALALTIFAAMLLNHFVARPVEQLRATVKAH